MDPAVVDAAVRYLIGQQRKNGAFPRIGKVHNYQLLVSWINAMMSLIMMSLTMMSLTMM